MIFFQKNYGVFVRLSITMRKKGRKFWVFWHEVTIRPIRSLSWNFVSKGGPRCATGDVIHPAERGCFGRASRALTLRAAAARLANRPVTP